MTLIQTNVIPLYIVSNSQRSTRHSLLMSPILSGSYLGGSDSLVHVGRTPINSLKLNPNTMLVIATREQRRGYTEEQRHRDTWLRGLVYLHPVNCALPLIVGHAHQEVPNIDYDCAFDWRSFDPFPTSIED